MCRTLRTGWNYYLASHREACLKAVKDEKPYLLIVAFPCSVWSPLMRLVKLDHVRRLRARDKILVTFAAELARIQAESGRHFLIENPDGSAA